MAVLVDDGELEVPDGGQFVVDGTTIGSVAEVLPAGAIEGEVGVWPLFKELNDAPPFGIELIGMGGGFVANDHGEESLMVRRATFEGVGEVEFAKFGPLEVVADGVDAGEKVIAGGGVLEGEDGGRLPPLDQVEGRGRALAEQVQGAGRWDEIVEEDERGATGDFFEWEAEEVEGEFVTDGSPEGDLSEELLPVGAAGERDDVGGGMALEHVDYYRVKEGF